MRGRRADGRGIAALERLVLEGEDWRGRYEIGFETWFGE